MTGFPSDFRHELYPFLYEAAPHDAGRLDLALAEVRGSTLQKSRDIVALRAGLESEYRDQMVQAAGSMAERFAAGGKLLAFGNGGSATDAQDAAADCMTPPVAGWPALPALALVNDVGVVTAVANDVGFENVFVRQIIALGEAGDMALGFTTSGNSPNVVAALGEARRRGMLTVALSGYDGGAVARAGTVDHCFVARVEDLPRIQEGHATVWHTLLELVQVELADRTRGARP
ncbi:MAG: SIS domain-containing protein [Gemmatimonadales bacterium]|nr:SIS domain-containing protein [Gemmatimonadales bacterium]